MKETTQYAENGWGARFFVQAFLSRKYPLYPRTLLAKPSLVESHRDMREIWMSTTRPPYHSARTAAAYFPLESMSLPRGGRRACNELHASGTFPHNFLHNDIGLLPKDSMVKADCSRLLTYGVAIQRLKIRLKRSNSEFPFPKIVRYRVTLHSMYVTSPNLPSKEENSLG